MRVEGKHCEGFDKYGRPCYRVAIPSTKFCAIHTDVTAETVGQSKDLAKRAGWLIAEYEKHILGTSWQPTKDNLIRDCQIIKDIEAHRQLSLHKVISINSKLTGQGATVRATEEYKELRNNYQRFHARTVKELERQRDEIQDKYWDLLAENTKLKKGE